MFRLDNRCKDVYFNLAAEEYLLKQKRDNYFMLWQAEPCVVIGKHQEAKVEVNEGFLQERGIALARRFSGGGAVYHDMGNVNLSFIETVGKPDFDCYLQQTIGFLYSLGIAAYADARMGIYIGGRKISGSAQCVHKNRVLYHCTLLYSTNLAVLNAALTGDEEAERLMPDLHAVRGVPSVRSEVTNIQEHMPQRMGIERFIRLLLHHFQEDGENRMYRFTNEDMKAIERLRNEKYAVKAWNYHRSVLKVELLKP